MGRSPCCSKEGLNRGAWTAIEDKTLTDYIRIHGEGKWRNLPKKAGLKRCGKSCRLRWLNYLRPDIKRGNITQDEEELIIRLHKLLGNRWSLIAGRLPGRTDNEIKNYWNTNIGKKLQNQQNQQINPAPSNHTPSFLPNQPDHNHHHHHHHHHHQQKPNSRLLVRKSPPPRQPSRVVMKNSEASVVRTKASRCSKVILPLEPQNMVPTAAPSRVLPEHVSMDDNSSSMRQTSLSHMIEYGSPDDDLVMDFEMDEKFLSDLLNTDFSQLASFNDNIDDNVAAGGGIHGTYCINSSPNSDQTLFHSDDTLESNDFPSTTSLNDSEFDWFGD